jgi:hypothetical protein
LVQAQAGTLTSVAATPQTAVPKDASGMTGAAIIPSGTTAQRPGTPANGWLRFNSDLANNVEVYDAGTPGWRPLAYAQAQTVYPDLSIPFGSTVTISAVQVIYNNITIAGTLNVVNAVQLKAVGEVSITGTLSGAGTGIAGGLGQQLNGATQFVGFTGRNLGGGAYAGAFLASQLNNTYSWATSLLGSSGGSGGVVSAPGGSTTSTSGGSCGASLFIEAQGSIVFSGTCDFSGQTPATGTAAFPSSCGGSGGGSGGALVLISNTLVNLGGTIDVSGGDGGNANNNGQSATAGGGGGGGWVVIQSPSNTVTATINKAGGVNGAGAGGAVNILGGNGGSFAGAGGQQGTATYGLVTVAGQPGYLSNNGVLS